VACATVRRPARCRGRNATRRFAEPAIRTLLELPEPWATAAFIPVGYPVGRGHGPVTRKPLEAMVFTDRWGGGKD